MLKVTDDIKLDFDDVLIIPQPSDLNSRSEVSLERKICMPNAKMINPHMWRRKITYAKDVFENAPRVCWEGIPVICANMDTVGTMEMAKVFAKEKMLVALHKHYSEKELINFFVYNKKIWTNVFYTVGSGEQDFEKLARVGEKVNEQMSHFPDIESHMFPRMICLDIANGYSKHFCDVVKRYRETYPWAIIMAGNVVTGNMAERLIESGADIVKVGIGPGATCLTRVKTGIGYPQLSAIAECAFQVHGSPAGHICGDGGCRTAGDVSKAFAAGADFVMLGSMFAGTDACEGEWEYDDNNNKKALKFYGMSSTAAQEKYNGGLKKHRTSEGRVVSVDYKGKTEEVIQDILGGVRSACTYTGARNIKDLPKCAKFARVNSTHNDFFERK